MNDAISQFITQFDQMGLYPDFYTITDGVNEPECTIEGKKYLLFCANNYLGMTNHPEVKQAAKDSIDKYGVGPGGSRVISGNVDIIEQLERTIADWTGTEDCLTFPTGYMANVGVIRAMMDPLFGDKPHQTEDGVIFSDESNHGSIVDGCKLTKARKVVFKHDDLEDLERKIQENDLPNKLIITESVFSLDGEIVNIPKYIELARKYGAKIMVDDAHGIGVLGQNGGGVTDHFKCADGIDVLMGCMDKAMGGTGGYICGKKDLIKYLRIACRSSILSSAITTSMAGAMIKVIDLAKSQSEVRSKIKDNARLVKQKLRKAGFEVRGNDNLPVLGLIIGDERNGILFCKRLMETGIFVSLFRWPAVPLGSSRARISLMPQHTELHIQTLVDGAVKVGRELQLIP